MTFLNKYRDLLTELEDNRATGYVPPSPRSGVTVGIGFDLGHQTEESVNALDISQETKNLLLTKERVRNPRTGRVQERFKYLGKRGAAARRVASSLTIPDNDLSPLNEAVAERYKNNFETSYSNIIGRPVDDDLNENQKLALASMFFNTGSILGTAARPTNLANQLKNKEFNAAAYNISSWGKRNDGTYVNENLRPRRVTESLLFSNQIAPEDINTVKSAFTRIRGQERKNALDAYEGKAQENVANDFLNTVELQQLYQPPPMASSQPPMAPSQPPDLFADYPSPFDGSFYKNDLFNPLLSRIKKAWGL